MSPSVFSSLAASCILTRVRVFCAIQKLEAKVLKKTARGLEVAILPDEFRATLPTMQLSDHVSHCQLLWECLQEGDNISNLICTNRGQQNIVSLVSGQSHWKRVYFY